MKIFVERKIDFPVSAGVKSSKVADYCVAVITNALWYVTNDHHTINNARKHHSSIIPIPKVFENFDGYNDVKRRKMKSLPLDRTTLHSHTQALYSLLLRPCASTEKWKSLADDVKQLADSLTSYEEYLRVKSESITSVRSSMAPARQLSEDMTIKHTPSTTLMNNRYNLIDEAVRENGIRNPVVFDEGTHRLSKIMCNVFVFSMK